MFTASLSSKVTRLSHFEYVQLEDLERIGLGKPAARRLLEAVKKRRTAAWMKSLVSRILPSTTGSSSQGKTKASAASDDSHTLGLTCLIPEQVSESSIWLLGLFVNAKCNSFITTFKRVWNKMCHLVFKLQSCILVDVH